MITNTDLDVRVTELTTLIATDPGTDEIRAFVVAVIRQAYEEAAKMAEYHHDHCATDCDRFYCLQEAAVEIRALGEEFDK